MAHDLYANNPALEHFHMAGQWTHLLAQCGAYFTCIHSGARWFMLYDERMTTHYHGISEEGAREAVIDLNYPAILCNCGFEITADEAMVLARIARNYAAIQRSLEEPTPAEMDVPFDLPAYKQPFPQYIRRDWVETYERFAEWAEHSQGFKVY